MVLRDPFMFELFNRKYKLMSCSPGQILHAITGYDTEATDEERRLWYGVEEKYYWEVEFGHPNFANEKLSGKKFDGIFQFLSHNYFPSKRQGN